ncbi:MAG: hypothetical protein COX79_05470 [Candidatus Levybacteria bacterium CG_4_10_14_0_2_um_filter_36_16]|nr:MAG: hypothetical protein AUK12_04665 [Candidatus Levybacteria bacterium CG2_30_37_29]PIZ96338.1 MAG: hypothetical protein COX79_05470 [Candidatus Levybacteria bacterium CG_4_10_14_0_2_um_filter_36_16]
MRESLAYKDIRPEQYLPREIVGSKAFNLEYYPGSYEREAIREDVVSYLGEYRLQVPKFHYQLQFSQGEEGLFALRDSFKGEPMVAKGARAIQERSLRGENVSREKAELVGIRRLEDQLRFGKTEDTILWASPPGPKEEGYGDYGFIYKGSLQEKNGVKKITMTAIRVENPNIDQFNFVLSQASGIEFKNKRAEDFLQNPILVEEQIDEKLFDNICKKQFAFLGTDEAQAKFNRIIARLSPLIEEVVDVIQKGNRREKIAAFRALENYTLMLKKGEDIFLKKDKPYVVQNSLSDILPQYNYVPPAAFGSCGGTLQSNNIFSLGQSLSSVLLGGEAIGPDRYGDRKFKCPSCRQTNIRPFNSLLPSCQHCGSTEVAC